MKKISILDTTSNGKEQTPQNVMNPIMELQIPLKLESIGGNYFETEFPTSSKYDFKTIELIDQKVTQSAIAIFSRALNKNVNLAFDTFGRSQNYTIQIMAIVSDIPLANKYNITCTQAIDEMINQFTLLIKIMICLLELKDAMSRAENLRHL